MVETWKNKFNKKFKQKKDQPNSISDISKLTGYPYKNLKAILKRGEAAFVNNRKAVRPNVKSAVQWGYARVYSAVMGGGAAKSDKDLLIKKNQKTHTMPNGDIHTGKTHTKNSKLIKKAKKNKK